MMFDLVIYHGDCADGSCAAALAQLRFPQIEMVAARHGDPEIPFERFRNRRILMVDFTYKREVMRQIGDLAESVQVLDHHASAVKELKDFSHPRMQIELDMTRSGAMMAWEFLGGSETPPWFVPYVQDRDLWRWALPESRAINAFFGLFPNVPETWEKMLGRRQSEAVSSGTILLLAHNQHVQSFLPHAFRSFWWTQQIAVVNCPPMFVSDVGHQLNVTGVDVSVMWYHHPQQNQMIFSLRSQSTDVLDIARLYGGGGHPNAAGFELPFRQGMNLLSEWIDAGNRPMPPEQETL